jgi:hypothetical protein
MFAAVLLIIAGVLNIVYGIAAISEANFFTAGGTHYVFWDLNAWGWVAVIVGIIQLTGGISLATGNTYGVVIGIIGATIGAIESLLAIGGDNPWWALGIFALCVWVLYGLIVSGEDVDRVQTRA